MAHKSNEKKSHDKKHLIERLFKLLLLTLVVLRILNHFNLKFPVAPLMVDIFTPKRGPRLIHCAFDTVNAKDNTTDATISFTFFIFQLFV